MAETHAVVGSSFGSHPTPGTAVPGAAPRVSNKLIRPGWEVKGCRPLGACFRAGNHRVALTLREGTFAERRISARAGGGLVDGRNEESCANPMVPLGTIEPPF